MNTIDRSKKNKIHKKKKNQNEMTFLEHANELRKRIFISLIIIFIIFTVFMIYSNLILDFLIIPLKNLGGFELHYLKVQEAFLSTFKAAFFASMIVSSPLWSWIIIGFFTPAFDRKGKILFFSIFFISLFFLFSGFIFSYEILIPISLNYLLSFGKGKLTSIISIGFYLDFFLMLFFATGVGFQLPLVMLFLSKFNIVEYKTLAKGWKYAVVIILIIAAAVTPPDIISQIIMTIPLLVLYGLGLILILIFDRKKQKVKAENEK